LFSTKAGRRRLAGGLFVAAIAATFVLGLIGYDLDARQAQPPPSEGRTYGIDLLYRTLQLFVLEFNPFSELPTPWPLEVARWLGAIVAGIALFKAAEEIFHRQFDDWRLRRLHEHVIVCGLGRKGFELVKQLRRRGDAVVVIEIDEGDDSLPTCRELGVTVLAGDARSEQILKKAGLRHAARLLAVCKNDSDNIEIALQAREVILAARRDAADPLVCHVHIIDLKLAELFKQHKIFSCTRDPFEARIFSFYENAARELLIRHPLELRVGEARASAAAPAVHLVIVGFGQMGESVALQAARIGHYAGGNRLRITVFDPDADQRRLSLLARYPQLEQVVDLAFDSRNVEHPTVRQQLAEWAASERERLVLTIAIDDDPRALSIALNLPAALRERNVPVYVRQSEQRGLATLIDDRVADDSVAANVTSFGSPEVSAGVEQILQERLDVLARAIHERYVAQRLAGGAQPGGDPALAPWPQLDAGYRSSNRQQADHIDVKLRAAGCRRLAEGESPPADSRPFESFTKDEVELLAHMEHARWCADRYLGGWRYGETADKPRKISPYLVPYDQLTEEIKQYDREAVLQIPELVKLAGQRIVRLA
jgi:voltage-gated potassium channel Kch